MPRGVPRIPGESVATSPDEPQAGAEQAAPLAESPEADLAPADGALRAADVDPTKLRRAVLTADGWVCPSTSPAPPAKE